MTSCQCSQDARLYLQVVFSEDNFFEQKGVELLLVLNGYPTWASNEYQLLGQCISFDFRKIVKTIFSKPGRASNYSVDGTVYAGLIQRMAEFLIEPWAYRFPLGITEPLITYYHIETHNGKKERRRTKITKWYSE